MNRISFNFYPFDRRENWNLRCLLAYTLASVVALFVSLRFRVPTFNQKTEGDGPPDAVWVTPRPDCSKWEAAFFHDPLGTDGSTEGLLEGRVLGYEWRVYYEARCPRVAS